MFKKNYILVLALGVMSFSLFAQNGPSANDSAEENPSVSTPSTDEIEIPTLKVLIDSAMVKSPLLKQQQNLLDIEKEELSILKKDWTDFLSFRSGIAYGTGGLNLTETGIANTITTTRTYRYDAGVYLNFSPSDVLTRRNKMRQQKAQIAYQEWKEQEVQDKLQLYIAEKYHSLENKVEVFKIYNDLKEQNLTNLTAAKHKFENGELDLLAYNEIQLKAAKINAEFEGAKEALVQAKYEIEMITGVKLSLTPYSVIRPIF